MTKAEKNDALKTTITRELLHGSCGVCEFDARKCQRPAGKVCIVFSPDEKKIAEVLK